MTFVLKAGTSADCAAVTPGQISKNTTCNGGASLGVIGPAVNTNQVITLNCTQ